MTQRIDLTISRDYLEPFASPSTPKLCPELVDYLSENAWYHPELSLQISCPEDERERAIELVRKKCRTVSLPDSADPDARAERDKGLDARGIHRPGLRVDINQSRGRAGVLNGGHGRDEGGGDGDDLVARPNTGRQQRQVQSRGPRADGDSV